jgi:hypothetical protein
MTKDELITVLGIAGVEPKIVEAMTQSYEMGFDHGAKVGEQMRDVVEKAVLMAEFVNFEDAKDFWDAYDRLRRTAQ